MKRRISQEQMDHLPSDLHRLIAKYLLDTGEWQLLSKILHQMDISLTTSKRGEKSRRKEDT